jgi:hypothetical protein
MEMFLLRQYRNFVPAQTTTISHSGDKRVKLDIRITNPNSSATALPETRRPEHVEEQKTTKVILSALSLIHVCLQLALPYIFPFRHSFFVYVAALRGVR